MTHRLPRLLLALVTGWLAAAAPVPAMAGPELAQSKPAAAVPVPRPRADNQNKEAAPTARSRRGREKKQADEASKPAGNAKNKQRHDATKPAGDDPKGGTTKPSSQNKWDTAEPPDSEQPAAATDEATASDPTEACIARLKTFGIDAAAAEMPAGAKAGCTIEVPVRLKAVAVAGRSGPMVRFPAQPLVACRLAEALGRWSGTLAAPLMAGHLRSELVSIETGPGFECRFRNRATSGKLSAHANGLAVDVGAFHLANGTAIRVGVAGTRATEAALASLRTAACGWFTTILGPGSDEAHRLHLHLDIITHGSSDRYRICQ